MMTLARRALIRSEIIDAQQLVHDEVTHRPVEDEAAWLLILLGICREMADRLYEKGVTGDEPSGPRERPHQ